MRICYAVNTAPCNILNMKQKILVLKHGALGDILLAMGVFKAIRQHHPDAHVVCMCRRQFVDLCTSCGYFDEVIVETMPKWYRPLEFLRISKIIGGFDRVYDLQNNDRTRIYLSLIPKHKRPEWNGAHQGASLRYDPPERVKQNAVQLFQSQLEVAGITGVEPDNLSWMKADTAHYALPEKYALIIAGCSPKHPEKRWPPEFFAEICRFLNDKNIKPVLIGTKDEKDVLDIIHHAAPFAVNLCGQTPIFDIPVLARNAVMAIGNDTGPVHMVALTGCKTVAIYQGEGTKWQRSAITGENAHILHAVYITDVTVDQVKDKITSVLP